MAKKLIILKQKALRSPHIHTPYIGGLSKDFKVGYIRTTGLTGNVYDFSVDYWAIADDKILEIHKHLMEKNNII